MPIHTITSLPSNALHLTAAPANLSPSLEKNSEVKLYSYIVYKKSQTDVIMVTWNISPWWAPEQRILAYKQNNQLPVV